MMRCPSCGYERKEIDQIIDSSQCPKCGIVYTKWKQVDIKKNADSVSPEPSVGALETEKRSDKFSLERWLFIGAGGVVALVLIISVLVPFVTRQFKSVEPASVVFEEEQLDENKDETTEQPDNQKMAAPLPVEPERQSAQDASGDMPDDSDTLHHKPIYCYADAGGKLNFVEWRTGLQVMNPDGSLNRENFVKWSYDQVGGNPNDIEPDREARNKLDREREEIFKKVLPYKSMGDNLTKTEQDLLERQYQLSYSRAYNQALNRRNEAVRKLNYMLKQFEDFEKSRK